MWRDDHPHIAALLSVAILIALFVGVVVAIKEDKVYERFGQPDPELSHRYMRAEQ